MVRCGRPEPIDRGAEVGHQDGPGERPVGDRVGVEQAVVDRTTRAQRHAGLNPGETRAEIEPQRLVGVRLGLERRDPVRAERGPGSPANRRGPSGTHPAARSRVGSSRPRPRPPDLAASPAGRGPAAPSDRRGPRPARHRTRPVPAPGRRPRRRVEPGRSERRERSGPRGRPRSPPRSRAGPQHVADGLADLAPLDPEAGSVRGQVARGRHRQVQVAEGEAPGAPPIGIQVSPVEPGPWGAGTQRDGRLVVLQGTFDLAGLFEK